MNIDLQPAVPVDLYAATGITVGAQISVLNNFSTAIKLSTTEAGLESDYRNLLGYKSAFNDSGDAGAWVVAVNGGFINVKEV